MAAPMHGCGAIPSDLESFLDHLNLSSVLHDFNKRGVSEMAGLSVVCSHDDLRLLAPSLASDEHTFSFLRLYKAILAYNGNVQWSQMPKRETQKKKGTPACGAVPWTELSEEYVGLRESTKFCFPVSNVQLGLQLQGVLKMRKGQKMKMKNRTMLRAAEATGCMYLDKMDADHLEPIFDILFPQQKKDQKHIGFANSMTDFMQNCRSGSVKPWLVTSSDVQAFMEKETYRPPESKRKLASVDELDKLDLAVDQQIISLLAGCESLAKKNTVTILDKLEELSKTEPLLGQPVRDYLAQLRTQAKALTEQNTTKRQQRAATAAAVEDESQSESEEE